MKDRRFTVKVGSSTSRTFPVRSGVPQGTILGPLLFLIYINDLPGGLKCFASLFADDLKLLIAKSQREEAQEDLNYLTEWQKTWLLTFNTLDNKCKVLHVGNPREKFIYSLNSTSLPEARQEKDLGVLVTSELSWSSHIKKCVSKANSMVGWVTRNLIRKDIKTMITVYKSLVRPHLEYCVQLWNPVEKHGNWKVIMELEDVQREFTRRIENIGLLTYRERLKLCGLTTLLERRARGDLIECFKIWRQIVDYGHDLLHVSRSGYNLNLRTSKGERLHDAFPSRIVMYWNKIPDEVKDVETTASFKHRLEVFKSTNINNPNTGQYWELSEMLLSKLESNQKNRDDYVAFMIENPLIAKRRFIINT